MTSLDALSNGLGERDAREQAAHVLQRWRLRGFDVVLLHPSGYCSPANSSAIPVTLREGYDAHPIESAAAFAAVAESIAAGMAYRA